MRLSVADGIFVFLLEPVRPNLLIALHFLDADHLRARTGTDGLCPIRRVAHAASVKLLHFDIPILLQGQHPTELLVKMIFAQDSALQSRLLLKALRLSLFIRAIGNADFEK